MMENYEKTIPEFGLTADMIYFCPGPQLTQQYDQAQEAMADLKRYVEIAKVRKDFKEANKRTIQISNIETVAYGILKDKKRIRQLAKSKSNFSGGQYLLAVVNQDIRVVLYDEYIQQSNHLLTISKKESETALNLFKRCKTKNFFQRLLMIIKFKKPWRWKLKKMLKNIQTNIEQVEKYIDWFQGLQEISISLDDFDSFTSTNGQRLILSDDQRQQSQNVKSELAIVKEYFQEVQDSINRI